jgi:hypothetical protein
MRRADFLLGIVFCVLLCSLDGFLGLQGQAIASLEVFNSFDAIEQARQDRGVTLGLVRPSRLVNLDITNAQSPEWTPDEVAKLMQAQAQASLFDQDAEQRSLRTLRKLPYDFHYVYQCSSTNGELTTHRHKLVDWEAGALYWNVHRRVDWREAFRTRLFDGFAKRDLVFLMGTIHRFPDKWLIVSVLYPQRSSDSLSGQESLFPP